VNWIKAFIELLNDMVVPADWPGFNVLAPGMITTGEPLMIGGLPVSVTPGVRLVCTTLIGPLMTLEVLLSTVIVPF
jgi:hypothetical protein